MNRRKFFQDSAAGLVGIPALTSSIVNEGKSPVSPQGSQEASSLKVGGPEYSVEMDKYGNIRKIHFRNQSYEPPSAYSFFELNGNLAEAEHISSTRGLSFRASSEKAEGTFNLFSDKEIHFQFQPAGQELKEVGLVLTFPLETVFHLAEYSNTGRVLDKDMPNGEIYSGGLHYNFFVANYRGMWIRFRTDDRWFGKAKVEIARHPEMFTVTFKWHPGAHALMGVFSSLEETRTNFQNWLESDIGIRKLRDRPDLPKWVFDINLVITVDMMRSNWEVVHDYNDLLNLGNAIKGIRNPKEILFYVPGWQGAYDICLPDYKPCPALGGKDKFREMLEGLHKDGFRVMIHTTSWGINPYSPEIDFLQKFATHDGEKKKNWPSGAKLGWQINQTTLPNVSPLKFATRKIPLRKFAKSGSFSFMTDPLPGYCEALFTVGGVKAKQERITFTVGHRTVRTPPRWFEEHGEYKFIFPLALEPGVNEVRVEVIDGSNVNWKDSWYKIRYAFTPQSPYSPWTHPILHADVSNPEYIKIFTDQVSSVVHEYDVDAVHVDATPFDMAKPLLMTLRKKLPGVAIACEWSRTFEAMGYWSFWQGASRRSLTERSGTGYEFQPHRCPCDVHDQPPSEAGREELYTWLDKASPVCGFVKDYSLLYPHLCAADAFVPVGKVCDIFPPRQMPPRTEQLWKILKDTKRLSYIPGLRVNYRKYGLDEDTKRALRELAPA